MKISFASGGRFRAALPLTLVSLLAALPLIALDPATLKPQGYVSDFAGVIDAESKAKLERYCQQLKESTGVELAFVTVATLDGAPIEEFANRLYTQWGIGAKATSEGALLLLSINERKSRLEVGYGLEATLPDGSAGSVLRAMRPALKDSHYGDAFVLAAEALGERVRGTKLASPDKPPPPPIQTSRPRKRSGSWLAEHGPTIVFIIILLLVLSQGGGGFLGPLLMASGRGGGFGGFGGSSGGGGGFGGFGGGNSGGGGASSDW